MKKYILKAERLYKSDRHFQAFENSYINLMGGGRHAYAAWFKRGMFFSK